MMFSKKNQVGNYGKGAKKSCKITNADRWYSRFIRVRDSVLTTPDGTGYTNCITCGKYKKITECDCGHYVTRDRPMTRFHLMNTHAQCKNCNGRNKGEQGKHGLAIDKKYGSGTAQMLMNLGDIRGQKIHSKMQLKEIAEDYKKMTYDGLKDKKIKKWW